MAKDKKKKATVVYADANPEDPFDEHGKIIRYHRTDFIVGKEGTIAHIDYKIALLEAQKERVIKQGDPLTKKKAQLERARAKVAALEAELSAGE